jgi:two-component system cell cycle sensor histidine kinase/response regulator CckA
MSPGSHVVLEVADDGCGMNEATKDSLFDPFFTTKFTGRGLGMSAVMGIVRAHRGGFKITSAPGAGTCIQVLLPVEPRGAANRGASSPRRAPGHRTVALVIDDEPGVHRVIHAILTREGYEVLHARDGCQAIELFHAHHLSVGLVVLDLTMPVFSGPETLAALRQLRKDVPVLLMSGLGRRIALERIDPGHVAAFVAKPFTPNAFAQAVRECRRRWHADDVPSPGSSSSGPLADESPFR